MLSDDTRVQASRMIKKSLWLGLGVSKGSYRAKGIIKGSQRLLIASIASFWEPLTRPCDNHPASPD